MMRVFLLLLLFAPLLFSASIPLGAEEVRPASIDAEAAGGLAKANNAFARDLYGVLKKGKGNLLFSPYSIQSALLMAREGAAAETAAQMDRVLHLGGLERGKAWRALRDSLRPSRLGYGWGRGNRSRTTYELNVANAVWAQKRYFVKNDFLTPLRDVYRAPLQRVDFADAARASRTLNAWAARETRNKIRQIAAPGAIDPLTRLALTNAVYFKAAWANEFAQANTKRADFFGPGGVRSKASLMRCQDQYAYAEVDGVQILWLPYLMGETAMVVFLPRARDGLKALEESYCAGRLDGWFKAMKSLEVDVSLPRFKFAAQYELKDALAALGMPDALSLAKADFSRVSDKENICIGAVLHKAFISVDEEGTEAAAVTATMMPASAMPGTPENPIKFRADHPFLFQITHKKTGATLFSGRVTRP